jgi:hypothetical protein
MTPPSSSDARERVVRGSPAGSRVVTDPLFMSATLCRDPARYVVGRPDSRVVRADDLASYSGRRRASGTCSTFTA